MPDLKLFHFDIPTRGNYGDKSLFPVVRDAFRVLRAGPGSSGESHAASGGEEDCSSKASLCSSTSRSWRRIVIWKMPSACREGLVESSEQLRSVNDRTATAEAKVVIEKTAHGVKWRVRKFKRKFSR